MTMCLSNETLIAVRLGEASPDEMKHATDCALCTGRLVAMRTDLARIDAILATPPRARVARPARVSIALRMAPFAVAAAAALVLLVARGDHSVDAPPRAPVQIAALDDVAAVADYASGTIAAVDDDGDGDDTDDNNDNNDNNDDDSDETTWAASTCALDEPFIGVGCDNGVQLTALSW